MEGSSHLLTVIPGTHDYITKGMKVANRLSLRCRHYLVSLVLRIK